MLLNARKINLSTPKNKVVLVAIEDITQRKQKEYKKFYDKLSLALEAGQIGTWELDPALGVVMWDARMHEIYGCEPHSFEGSYESWLKKVHPDDVGKVTAKFKKFLVEKKPLDVECRIVRNTGDIRWVHIKALVSFDPNDPKKIVVIGTTWDITEAENLRIELSNEKKKLVHLIHDRNQVNKELESFAYITSHDLKAPLRGIESLATWIEKDVQNKLTDESKENLLLLRTRVSRLSNLIQGILLYTRAGRIDLNVTTVSIKELLDEVIDTLNPPKTFTIHYSENLPTFTAAKVPLIQVFSNLISNSIKYNNSKKGHIEIGVKDAGEFYEFSVGDDGIGIEPEYHKKIFQLFQTLQSKDKIESTGIGLTIVKKIVELNHGKVSVISDKGKGATFCFTWPKG